MVSSIVAAVTTGQARFDLVLGPRGAGKSHLLGLIEGRLRKALEGSALVAGLPEELHPSSLVHLLAELLRALPADPEAGLLARQLAILAEYPPAEARDRAVGMIRAQLRGLPLVIIIENLEIVFAAIGREGQHQLRSILQTERNWSIVATSRSLSPAFSKESEPFYGTFIPRTLEPLSAEGCRAQLVRLAHASGRQELARELDTPVGLARVQTLRHVLGSYPRAMAFIFPHLHHDEPEMVERALHELAEELTPYFQEQMGRLSPGQRPIAELLAEHWTPPSVSEIARATFNTPATTSTHLKHLRADAIVRSEKLGREHFYEIVDPMFRIARAMKRNEIRATTFLRVLQGWYEFRGMDTSLLPAKMQGELRELAFSDLEGQYAHERIEPLLRKLKRRRFRQVLDDIDKIDVRHPTLAAMRIVALSYCGPEEKAFVELTTAGSSRIPILVSGVLATEQVLAGCKDPFEFLASGQGSSVGRFAAAVMAIGAALDNDERSSLAGVIVILEQVLRSSSAVVRNSATEVVVKLAVPFNLVRTHEYELCGRLIELLQPIGSAALSINLAQVAVQAWAADRIADVFRRRSGGAYALSRDLGALAKLGLLLVTQDEDVPQSVVEEIPAAFEAFFAQTDVVSGKLDIGDQVWLILIMLLIIQGPSLGAMQPTLEQMLLAQPAEVRVWWASSLHAGILHWIAAGRDLSPIAAARSLDNRVLVSFGITSTIVASSNPDVAYIRLAAPERAIVREFAAALGLEERYAALSELSCDEA
jgi:DNA-binding transcriptional ArsR family regulator